MECPACGEVAPDGANWCEACGTDLHGPAPAPPCTACGAAGRNIDDDRYCGVCGHRQPNPADHQEIDLGSVAGVSDKGITRVGNEDAMALRIGGSERPDVAVVVVCDGVGSTDDPREVSQAAADAAADALLANALDAGDPTDPTAAVTAAIAGAQAAVVAATPPDTAGLPPSCTIVAALLIGNEATVGWLGDSRAYALGPEPALLTTDHTWEIEMAALGQMTAEQIAADERAGSITRWLGADAQAIEPEVVSVTLTEGDTLMVCSDGLWNYEPDPQSLADRLEHAGPRRLEAARELVQFANDAGGRDNITVVLAVPGGTP